MSVPQQRRKSRIKGGKPNLKAVVLKNEGEGFRHYFDTESQTILNSIGESAVAAFNGRFRLVENRHWHRGKNAVTIIASNVFKDILKQPGSRLGRHSSDLARSIILGECANIPTDPIDVTLGRFVVSKVSNSGIGHALLATIEDPKKILHAEYAQICAALQTLEGVKSLAISDLNPHATIGVLPQMAEAQIFRVARSLSKQYGGTPLTLQPLQ